MRCPRLFRSATPFFDCSRGGGRGFSSFATSGKRVGSDLQDAHAYKVCKYGVVRRGERIDALSGVGRGCFRVCLFKHLEASPPLLLAARLDVVDAVLRKFDKAVENHSQCERGVFETQERH